MPKKSGKPKQKKIKKKPTNPDQPLIFDDEGTLRFKVNEIVRYLLDYCTEHNGPNLNDLALIPFSEDDRIQLAQLIGYSFGGFGELPYVTDERYYRAQKTTKKPRKL